MIIICFVEILWKICKIFLMLLAIMFSMLLIFCLFMALFGTFLPF